MQPEIDVCDADVRRFLDILNAATGYDLREYNPRSMRRRVLAALARSGLSSLADLERAALADANVLSRVLDDLTVRVTEMFRDPVFYRALRASVVPMLRTYPLLRIWHAGCSTGEEVYSTAILLEEEGLYDRAQIYATDINANAVEHAKQGIYSEDLASAFAENHAAAGGLLATNEYVSTAYSRFAFRERLKKNVLFFQHDLVNDHVFGEMHLVFCRNVLMYFGQGLRRRVLEKIAKGLAPGGFLCLGSAERIPRPDRGGAPFVDFASQVNIYRKQE